MEKQQSRIHGLGDASLLTKSFQQEFLKALFPFRGDPVNRALSPARHLFAAPWRDIARLGELAYGIIKGADIDVGIALDQSIAEAAFDFVGMKVAPMERLLDKNLR